MKKLTVLSVLLVGFFGFTPNVFATDKVCNAEIVLKYDGNQATDDDEFLYRNGTQRDLAWGSYNNGTATSGRGVGYECDQWNSHSCDRLSVVELEAGHWFKGQQIDKRVKYQCQNGGILGIGNDKWVPIEDVEICNTRQYGDIKLNECYKGGRSTCLRLEQADCSGYDFDSNATAFYGYCRSGRSFRCEPIECKSGYKVDNATKKCVIDTSINAQADCEAAIRRGDRAIWSNGKCECLESGAKWDSVTKSCKGGSGGGAGAGDGDDSVVIPANCQGTNWTSTEHMMCCAAIMNRTNAVWTGTKCVCGDDGWTWDGVGACRQDGQQGGSQVQNPGDSCRARRTTAEGKACCNLANSVAQWTGSSDSDPNGKCVCTGGMEFKIENGRGVCVPPAQQQQNPGQAFQCTEGMIKILNEWMANPSTPAVARTEIAKLLAICAGATPNEQEVQNMYIMIQLLIYNGESNPAPDNSATVTVRRQTSKRAVDGAYTKIQTMVDGFRTTVWRDAEGKFNTSRLISDSVAGVVLGTAGGLITSNVIKKSQIKNGLEDISCTIGGQTVAGWGDEFSVGLQ